MAVILAADWMRLLFGPSKKASTVISNHTLRIQSYALTFVLAWVLIILIPSTIFVRTRQAKIVGTVNPADPVTLTDPVYRHYGFSKLTANLPSNIASNPLFFSFPVRCLTIAPWFTLIFGIPAAGVTWLAYLRYHLGQVQIDPEMKLKA